MINSENFYNDLSAHYHLIFQDWNVSIEKQGKLLASLLPLPKYLGPILDCACGIGTQLIGLKKLDFDVEGSDFSKQEVIRALKESENRNLTIDIRVDDMRSLKTAPLNFYGAILAMDNAIPHLLNDDEIINALSSMISRLKHNGVILLSIRDYEQVIASKPKTVEPSFFNDEFGRRIVHQVWDWQDDRNYIVHLYITQEINAHWVVNHFVGQYRAITTKELQALMVQAGFSNVVILPPTETGFYQPIIKGIREE